MRHTSRTHRVNLNRLFDRIKMDARIQIKYVKTSKQSADMLTKGSFTKHGGMQLTHSFNVLTLHMRTWSQHLFFFALVQEVDNISKRHAEPTAENNTAKQRLVRNLCAYQPSQKFVIKHIDPPAGWHALREIFVT